VEALVGDRSDEAALARALEGRRFDLTVDLAAYDAPAVEKVFRVRRLALGRYVLISTGQVYLVTTAERTPFRETDSMATLLPEPPAGTPDHREWAYGIGKRRAEQALRALRGSHGVRGTILRLPVLIGEGDTSLRSWAYVERLLDGGPLLLPDGGARPVRFLYAGDVPHALFRWIEHGLPAGPIYNLAQPRIATLRQAIETMAKAAGVTPRFVDASWEEIERAGIARSFSPYGGKWVSVLDPGRAANQWGFSGTPMEEYLPRVTRWMLEHRPATSHPGYAQRALELGLADSLGRSRESVRS
jgi:nucleoside-diphosphate-sugar epimerase